MTIPRLLRGRRSGAAVVAILCAGLLAACGGEGGPTNPGSNPPPVDPPASPPPPPTPTGSLVAVVDTVRPYELVTLRVSGGVAVPDTVTGSIGAVPLRAIRGDDSTLVVLVPTGVSGGQEVRFTLGGRTLATRLTVREQASVGEATAAVTAVLDRASRRFDDVEASIAAAAPGTDTAAMRRFVAAGRAAVSRSRQDFMALTPQERAAAAPYIVAGAASVGLESGAAASTVGPLRSVAARGLVCDLMSSFEGCNQLAEAKRTVLTGASNLAACATKTYWTAAVTGAVGGGLGFLVGGPGAPASAIAGIKMGVAIGAGAGLGWCMTDVWEKMSSLYDASVDPVLAEFELEDSRIAPGAGPRVSRVAAGSDPAFVVGVPKAVNVYVDFRTISAATASGSPAVADLVRAVNDLIRKWDELRAKADWLSPPAIALPAAPRRVVRKKVPGGYLSVPSASPQPITGVGSGSDTWMVTFANPNQGDDLPFSFTVRFALPGHPDQDRSLSGLLKPAKYAVKGLTLTPAADTVMVGHGVTLAWQATDPSGDVLTDSLLLGRRPTWSSSAPDVARVDPASGAVTGVSGGTATVTAVLEDGRATAAVVVVPDISGTYTLLTENGKPVPGVVYEDSIYRIVTHGGSVTLRTDGTFSYSHSATGTNLATKATYDEGGAGSGTYNVNGTGTNITFTTLEKEGVDRSIGGGSISGDILSIFVSTPDGSGTATLRKQK